MGKPEKKGAELQQQAGVSKLSLQPLISKPGKVASGPANRQQLLGKASTAAVDAPTMLAKVKEALEQQLKDLSKSLEQHTAKAQKQIDGTASSLDDIARSDNDKANEVSTFKPNQIAEKHTVDSTAHRFKHVSGHAMQLHGSTNTTVEHATSRPQQ